MVDRKRKEFISEGDVATLLQRYDTTTILKLLQEMAYYAEPKMDWNELVKKTSTGITNAREYQLLWRHLAYRDSLLPVEDAAQLPDDESDIECELEASPGVGVDAVAEAVAHVKVMAASYVPSESDIPEDSTVEAPLTINIPYGLQRGPQEPSDSYWSSRGMNITFPVSLQKAADGLNGNGLASSINPRKRRKKWSAEEDEELRAAVKRHGEGSWALIAKEEFEGERTPSQLSQRYGAIRRRCDTSNTSTQSGLQRTEAQMAANRALSLAVGNRVPSKKVAVGIPPILPSGSITGAYPNGANSSSSLQGQQQSQSMVQGLPRAATSIPTTKARVPAKKPTSNSTSRAELMVTANSVAAAACMSGLSTTTSGPKVEPGKNAVPALVTKVEPIKNPSAASLRRPSGISSALNAEPGKTALTASLPLPLGTSSAMNAEPVKSASPASLPLGMSSSLNAEPVKTASPASLPSGRSSALTTEPVKSALVASSHRPSGLSLTLTAEPLKPDLVAPLARPSGISSAPNAEPVQPSGIISASKAEPVKPASVASLAPPSDIVSASKAEPVKNASATSLPPLSGVIAPPKAAPAKTASAASLPRQSGIISAPKGEPVKTASAVSLPHPSRNLSAPNAEPVKSIAAAATNTQAFGPLNRRHAVNGSPTSFPSNRPSPMAPLSKGPTIQINSVPSGFSQSRSVPAQRVPVATVMPQKPIAGAAITASSKPVDVQKEQTQGKGTSPLVATTPQPNKTVSLKPVGVQKEQTQGRGASPLVATIPQPNKTVSTNSVINTGKPVAARAEAAPSVMPKENQVLQTVVGSCTDKILLAKQPEKESSTTAAPLVGAEAGSKPKDEGSKGKSPDVATVTGQKGL